VRWRDLLKKDKKNDTKTLRRIFLGVGSQFMQQFGGINIMSYYMPTVLTKSVGLSEKMARLLSACNAVSYLVFSGIAVLLIERNGSPWFNASLDVWAVRLLPRYYYPASVFCY
jgi:hypothetical protein